MSDAAVLEAAAAAPSEALLAGMAPPPALHPLVPRPFRVAEVRRDTHDTWTLTLLPADGGGPIPYAPGQFNMLYAFGVGEVPISVSGDAARPLPLVHTLRSVGAVTKALCGSRPGDIVGVRGPYGTAWPMAAAEGHDVLLVAGGIGLAPLRPALLHLLAHRSRYGRIVVLAGARSQKDLLYRRELERWRSRFDLTVEPTVDYAAGGWHGHVGVVTKLVARGGYDPRHTVALVCGPEVMMRYALVELLHRGVPGEHIYLSMERNMKCGVGWCGHCQLAGFFVCKDGPVFAWPQLEPIFDVREA